MASSKVDLKLVLLGRHNVGKTCLAQQFIHNKFKTNVTATVGAAFSPKDISLPGGKIVTFGVWDTAGAERYESMSKIYYRGAKAALVCYDITNRESWEKVNFWIGELLETEKECRVYIVGTKSDLLNEGASRSVSDSDIEDLISSKRSQNPILHFLTSAKENVGIRELFERVASDFLQFDKPTPKKTDVDFDKSKQAPAPGSSGCC